MSKLKEDFPGFKELDAAGEATTAKVRDRIQKDTLTEIPGIGPATADKIKEAFDALDTPSDQANDLKDSGVEDDENITPASQAAALAAGAKDDNFADSETLVNEGGGPDDNAKEAGAREAAKSGEERNELIGHALDELTPRERELAGARETTAEKIAHSGSVYVYDPAGPYASRTAVRIPDGVLRIKVVAVGDVPPQKGMRVKDGDDEYTIQESLGPDSRADDWMKVHSPNTGLAFVR